MANGGNALIAAREMEGKEEKMNHDTKKLNKIVEAVRETLSPALICDADFKCEGWQAGMEQIEAAQIFYAKHTAGREYTGPVFLFCPWCGEEIK